jgi:hypothetical protein
MRAGNAFERDSAEYSDIDRVHIAEITAEILLIDRADLGKLIYKRCSCRAAASMNRMAIVCCHQPSKKLKVI